MKDPVCGMDVKPDNAPAKSEHKGETFYFCSAGCKHKFEKHPEEYASRKSSEHQRT
jgi:YHS domain-containing protein